MSEESIKMEERGEEASISTENLSDIGDPPKPPPRPKRRNKMRVKNLQLSSLQDNSLEGRSCHQNDILFRTDPNDQKKESSLKGHVNVLAVTTGGLRQQWKARWAVQDP